MHGEYQVPVILVCSYVILKPSKIFHRTCNPPQTQLRHPHMLVRYSLHIKITL